MHGIFTYIHLHLVDFMVHVGKTSQSHGSFKHTKHTSIFQRVPFDSKGWCIGTPLSSIQHPLEDAGTNYGIFRFQLS